MRYFGQSILFIGKTIKRNQFLQCCLHIALLLRHPTHSLSLSIYINTTPKNKNNKKKAPKKTNKNTQQTKKNKKQRKNKSMEVHDLLS